MHFEFLEPRRMLAGDVTARLVGDDLVISGDTLDNSVELAIDGGDLVVRGFDDTTINGAATPFVAAAGSATVADDLFVRLGAGNDVLILKDGVAVGDRALISLSLGNDEFGASNVTIGSDLNIFAWRGDDTIHLDGLEIDDDLTIHSTTGDDTINVTNSEIGDDIRARTGAGRDAFVLDDSTIGDDVSINLGRDDDDLVVRDSNITGNLITKMRKGDDFVHIDPSRIGGHANVGLGKGRDLFNNEGPNEFGTVTVRAGRGFDSVQMDPASTTAGEVRLIASESSLISEETIEDRLNAPTTGVLSRFAAAVDRFAEFFGTPENAAPTTSGIGDVDVEESAPNTTIDLFAAFDDAEDADPDLSYAITNNTNPSLFDGTTINPFTGSLILDYAATGTGTANLTVRATDTGGLFVDATFRVTVTVPSETNTAPTTSGIANVVVEENAADSVIDLFAAFDDQEEADAELMYSIETIANGVLFMSTVIDGDAGTLTLDYAPDEDGTASIEVRATDSGGLFVETTFMVTVNAAPANTSPTSSGLADVTVDQDSSDSLVDLFAVFDDAEDADEELTYEIVENTNPGLFDSTEIDPLTGILTLDYAADINGTSNITVRATDSGDLFVNSDFMVTVNGPVELSLRLLPLFGGAIESNDTFVTNDRTYLLRGISAPGATIDVDRDGDGAFDDGTTTAQPDGDFFVEVPLLHDEDNHGANVLQVRANNDAGQSLSQQITFHLSVGTVVRFDSSEGTFDVELLDADAPITVANFLGYSDRFTDSIVHRSLSSVFVIQGGSFTFDDPDLTPIPTDPPIMGEFSGKHSNERSYLSMALRGGDVDSGTAGWFINTKDNLSLDAVGHTPFGYVIGSGMDVVDAIEALPDFNLNGVIDSLNDTPSAYAVPNLPLSDFTPFTRELSGTVSVSADSTTLIGVGTAFTTELLPTVGISVGTAIRVGSEAFTVRTIISDTQLELSSAHDAGATDVSAFIHAQPTQQQLVVFNSIEPILEATVVDNAFTVIDGAAAGTLVGDVTSAQPHEEPGIYQIENVQQPSELNLNADDHFKDENAAAPLVLVEYMSMQCPACAEIDPIVQQLEENFDGDVMVVKRHLPLQAIFSNAFEAALATEAAGRQGKFDEMVTLLFERQDDWDDLADPRPAFAGYATELGLDETQFLADLDDPALTDRVNRDIDSATDLGVTSTPAFALNGTPISAPPNLSDFTLVVQDALDDFDDAFVINRRNGELIVYDPAQLDRATNPSFLLNVLASDTGGFRETILTRIDVVEGP